MTRLSTKTIRNYLKMGLLKGEKVDGTWRFSENEIGEFFQERFVKGALEIKITWKKWREIFTLLVMIQ